MHDENAGGIISDKKEGCNRMACQYEAGDMALGADSGEMRAPDAATELADGSRTQANVEPLEEFVPAQRNEAASEQGTCQLIDPGAEQRASGDNDYIGVCSQTLSCP